MKKSFFVLFLFVTTSYSQQKINGISFVASNTPITLNAIQPVLNLNANWVALMPYGFMKTETETNIQYNSNRQWWGETKLGISKTAIAFHQQKIKTMLKPQIWIPNGGFTGHIEMKSEVDWIHFEKSYEKFILDYASVAQDNDIELFCIGTELNNFIMKRPGFWEQLIIKIKSIYKGKLTYAENWDTYKNVSFLSAMDYIGIDAYFPLSKQKTPTVYDLETAWKPIKKEIKNLSLQYKKPILFTEFGYQSKDFTAALPWEHNNTNSLNLIAQNNSLDAIFKQFWKEKWFAGGFLWKWYDNHQQSGNLFDTDYTVQNKPSEKIVKNQFSKK